jgi:hypothetical protein
MENEVGYGNFVGDSTEVVDFLQIAVWFVEEIWVGSWEVWMLLCCFHSRFARVLGVFFQDLLHFLVFPYKFSVCSSSLKTSPSSFMTSSSTSDNFPVFSYNTIAKNEIKFSQNFVQQSPKTHLHLPQIRHPRQESFFRFTSSFHFRRTNQSAKAKQRAIKLLLPKTNQAELCRERYQKANFACDEQ